MATDDENADPGTDPATPPTAQGPGNGSPGRLLDLQIEDELKDSYLTYAMSVIVSRALPDVRDGLKPSQRRILVAMNDLNLSPTAARKKCAKISGDTSGNYHPHGEAVIYPTLVRMAQEWNMRCVLIDKQGNFGSIAGLPAAAMRYTEARLSPIAALMMEDLEYDTVDFVPTYDETRNEPTVLPSKFPNLLVNGANGIAVGMATSIPPHNLGEICAALVRLIDDPHVTIDELLETVPGPDFPTGGIVCGRQGIRKGYHTGRGSLVVRARARIEEYGKGRQRIVVTEIPYQQARDRIEEKLAELVNDDRIRGVSAIRNESDLKEPVRLILELKRDADAEVVLNQLYEYSPLQDTFSLIFLALVDGKPRLLTLKELLEEFLRHRVTVIRRRTQFLLARARRTRHVVEGKLLALADLDEVLSAIRTSSTLAEAKDRLMRIECPAAMLRQALHDDGFAAFQAERGVHDSYRVTAVQADAILRMTLGQLVHLEQDRLGQEFRELLAEMAEYDRILSDESNILALIRNDLLDIQRRHGDKRRTEITDQEIGTFNVGDLITEENMVVTISHQGYIKRTPTSTYRAQRRGGKGLKGAKAEEEDPIRHLFVASTHDYLLFFTSRGKVFWQKVYDLPELSRESRGRAVVNLLNLSEGERITDCRSVRDFSQPDQFLFMATRRGMVKKTALSQFSRPLRGGIIAIKLRDDDELVDVVITRPGDEVVLSTARGRAIRFRQSEARPMGRNTSGVRGVRLREGNEVVGMVVADPEATLLTVCQNGYGKRTPFGPNRPTESEEPEAELDSDPQDEGDLEADASLDDAEGADGEFAAADDDAGEASSSSMRYPTKGRGGYGVMDIKTEPRNGPVIGVASVRDDDELLMITARGKIQRIRASDVRVVGRNTQGVRIMTLEEADTLAAVVRVPPEERGAAGEVEPLPESPPDSLPESPPESQSEGEPGPV